MVKHVRNVDMSKEVTIEEPMKMRSGAGYLCKISCPDLQFPRMSIPWDIGVKPGLNNGPPNCKLALKFNSFKDNLEGTHAELANFLDRMDAMAIKYIVDNKKTLFGGKTKSDTVIKETFNRSIKEDPNHKYTPTFSAKVDFDRRTDLKRMRGDSADDLSQIHCMDIGCFTREGESLVAEEVLTKDSDIQAVVEPRHIWVTATGMGITYGASRCVVHKTSAGKNNFDFDIEELEPEQEGDGVLVSAPSGLEDVVSESD